MGWLARAIPIGVTLLLGLTTAQADPSARVGRLSLIEGEVTVRDTRTGESEAATANWPVTSGTAIATARGARAEVRIGSTAVRLDGATDLEFVQLDDEASLLRLRQGTVSVRVRDASEVVAGGTYRATATERLYDSEYMLQADESAPEWENEYSRNTKTTNITRLDAAMPAELDFATMKVSLTEASDGLTLLDVQSYDWLQVGDWPSANCAELRWGRPFSFFGCVNNGVTTFHFARVSEVTRYYSRWWGVYIRYSNGDAYSYGYDHDMNMTSIFGGNRMYGETVSMQLIASDADQIWQIDPFMSFQSWSDPDQNTQGCIETWRGPACWTRTVRNGGRNGVAVQ